MQRVRYERTQTMKFKGDDKKRFKDYLEKEDSGLSEDEKMTKIADRINSQFKRHESSYRAGHKSVSYHCDKLFNLLDSSWNQVEYTCIH